MGSNIVFYFYWPQTTALCEKKKKKALHQAVNLRLGGSSDSKSYETPQEQQPAIDWSEGAQQTEVKSHAHTDDQTLCV